MSTTGAELEPRPRAIVLDRGDNVAVALVDLADGDLAVTEPFPVHARAAIRAAHKVAIRAIGAGGDVVKYGEVIGIASAPIRPGDHVHVHNVTSGRLPGPQE